MSSYTGSNKNGFYSFAQNIVLMLWSFSLAFTEGQWFSLAALRIARQKPPRGYLPEPAGGYGVFRLNTYGRSIIGRQVRSFPRNNDTVRASLLHDKRSLSHKKKFVVCMKFLFAVTNGIFVRNNNVFVANEYLLKIRYWISAKYFLIHYPIHTNKYWRN